LADPVVRIEAGRLRRCLEHFTTWPRELRTGSPSQRAATCRNSS
jgi:hypothetical protein